MALDTPEVEKDKKLSKITGIFRIYDIQHEEVA
jgi:hypothetical protein